MMLGRLVRCSTARLSRTMSSKIVQTKEFPLAPRDESVSDEYHGVKVADPYRVLEDADNEQTVDFVHRINEYSRPVLDAAPNRDKIEARIRKLWDYRRVYSVGKQGEYLYFFVNDGVQNQDVLYQSSLDRTTIPPRVFLDMNAEAEDGSLSIRTMAWSKGETDKILAYSISENGSDESVMHFKTEDGVILEDKVHRLKHTSISWIGNHSVLYSRYRSDELEGKCGSKISTGELNSHTVYLHKLGTSQCDDVVVFEHDDPKYHIRGGVTFSSNYAYYILTRGCDPTNLFYLEKIVDGKLSGKKHAIVDQFEYKFDYHGSTEDKALILTNKDGANRFKVMSLPLDSEDASGLTELIPEYPDRTIENIAIIKQGLLVSTLKDLKITLALHDLETGEEILKIIDNEIMSCPGLSCRRTLDHFYMSVDTFTRPTTIFKVTINGDEVEKEVFDQSGNGDSHNFDNDIVVSDHNALNPDGTKVHYFVLESKKSAGSGNNNRPALVYGYGGFNISLLPGFSITRAMFVDNFDGVYVLTNLRGGSEFGEDWHAGGMLKVKENTFNDMISVVNDVVERGYTKHSRITIQGGSNGGLLVAACAQRAPQSVAAVVCNVGVLDMIRFPLFTVGAAWVTEYGDVKKPDFFEYLMRYSPLHNLKTIDPAVFPATLVLTADHDDRVVPGHSLKYLAELYHQAQRSETSKLLMGRIEEKAGHGAGKSTEKRIMEVVDIYSFMSTVLDLEWKE